MTRVLEPSESNNKIRSLGFSSLFISQVRGQSLLDSIHYDFLANVASFDVGIVVWQENPKYDTVRPFSCRRLPGAFAWPIVGHREYR